MIDQGGNFDTVYLDFAKAFDSVSHIHLLWKLESCNVTDGVLKWIEAFLTDCSQRVVLGGITSTWLPILSGVLQGYVLGPVLFVIYINDLPSAVCSQLLLYMDDTKITRQMKSDYHSYILQKDLDQLCSWAATWEINSTLVNATLCIFAQPVLIKYTT
jgi:ribonucleases P/MRP protein subunit RPP40